ncbi:MAG: chromosome segregation protein SMC [Deltaproteobacteria bacterium]|nr:chromosome segregation protein SMC [Deltaproteobacteria bacterium]
MKLKKLEISGFKSFPEKAAIEFPTGISAVVGPNGCGKSNIVDALRWVMGEQSVKQLRGKAMEDVIFAGTRGKAPLNMAEVSLTLLNDNGSAPEELKDFAEINVTRRLYRSGESAYFINRRPCRLKDIHNVFMGSGMGAKTYAVIQQGNIGAITDAGPEDRRLFIEEAAGVTRYKNRKKEALRKVASTNQNLLRVNDIIVEIERQMAGLKRQARKAERFKKYKTGARELDIRLGLHYFDDYAAKIRETAALLESQRDKDIQHTSQLKKIDAAVEEIKMRRWQKNQEISNQKSRQFDIQRRLDRTESDLAHLKEEIERLGTEVIELESAKTDLKEKNQSILTEIDQVKYEAGAVKTEKEDVHRRLESEREVVQKNKERLEELNRLLDSHKSTLMDLVAQEARFKNIYQNATNNKESLRRRQKRTDQETATAEKKVSAQQAEVDLIGEDLEQLRGEITSVKEEIQAVEKKLAERSQAFAGQVKLAQGIELEQNRVNSQYAALKKMEESYAWYKDGVKAVMQAARTSADGKRPENAEWNQKLAGNVLGLMADILVPEPTYEAAVEAVLGEQLQYIIVKQQTTGADAIDYLQTTGKGRSGFIPLPDVKRLASENMQGPEPGKLLLNRVSVKKGFENVAQALLGHVAVTTDMAEALELFNRNGRLQTIVTKNGDVISHQGIIIGGTREKLSGILSKKQEIKRLYQRERELAQKLLAARERQSELEEAVKESEDKLQQRLERKYDLSEEEVEKEKSLYKATESLKHTRRHLDVLRLEQEQLLGEESDIDAEMSQYNQAIADIEKRVTEAQAAVAETKVQIETDSREAESFNQALVELKLKLTSLDARLDNSNHTLKRLEEFRQDGLVRIQQIDGEIAAKTRRLSDSKEKIVRHEQSVTELYEELNQLSRTLELNESNYLEIETELKKNDDLISGIQNEREETLQKIRLLEIEHSQQKMQQENIGSRLKERYHSDVGQLRFQFPPSADEEPLDIEAMEGELEKLRKRMARIGDVNLGAIDEYDQLKNRYDFLVEQRDDLMKAINDLHRVIKKINRITQERFTQTFDAVNEKLKEVFPRLFEGGAAKLTLTEPNNPLETGVEYMIQPPGKKLTRMSLLSGGEKAMSAIAFIFSIFLIKPTSFCLMDEIDAPLDEANVFRFNDLLKVIGEKSQIIMITHNKRSMEFADTLFGITMGEKGVSKVVSVNLAKQQAA